MVTKITLMGAGGKMGGRILDNIKDDPAFEVSCVEVGKAGIRNLEIRGISPVPESDALGVADAVVLALPDRLIGNVSKSMIPQLKGGALVISLDPAAAYAGVIPIREDIAYFVCHPCHPPLFELAENKEEQLDWFGGVAAKQSVVCALHRGEEDDYQRGEAIAAAMFQPILRMHRITVEQMAILEPAIVETTTASLLYACKEAMEQGIKMGIPKEAARDFVLGHLRVELAIIFDVAGFPFSDGAMQAIKAAQSKLLKDDWKEQISNLDNIRRSVRSITGD
ncbi:MAG: semialdehyde dehydrogenase [Verrucomicrobia bacterium]|nr:semialdehyde dehydrogenase [Verrucomicrobiota bacterium]